jgi:hypothetical protein
MSNLLQRIKSGKKNHKIIDFPGTEEKVAIVTLSSNQTEACKIKAEDYIKLFKIEDETYKDMVLQRHLVYEFLRDSNDLDKRVATTFDELSNLLDVTEIVYFVTQYNLFSQESSPFLASVSEEQFELLKKSLPEMKWNELSGESLAALRNFLMSLV